MSKYITEFRHAIENVYTLDVTFREMPETSDAVLRILKGELIQFVSKCDGDILVTAWFCPDEETEDQIPLPDGSTHLIYRRADGACLNWSDYIGETKDTKETSSYFAIVSSCKTAEGIKPEKSWLNISVIFKKPTASLEIYEILVALCRDWAVTELEISAYAYFGDKNNPLSWKQIRDSDDAYLFVRWDNETREITRKDRVIGVIDKD